MKRERNTVLLEKADLIRMNQLVRRRTEYEPFLKWFQTLEPDEQSALIGQLCHHACQAGVDGSVYQVAARDAGFSEDDDFVDMMKKVQGTSGLNVGGLIDWLRSASVTDRARAFKWFVYLFGEAERQVQQREDRTSCNHWWHRDLDNPKVVESILNDPEYYKTSPRDDN